METFSLAGPEGEGLRIADYSGWHDGARQMVLVRGVQPAELVGLARLLDEDVLARPGDGGWLLVGHDTDDAGDLAAAALVLAERDRSALLLTAGDDLSTMLVRGSDVEAVHVWGADPVDAETAGDLLSRVAGGRPDPVETEALLAGPATPETVGALVAALGHPELADATTAGLSSSTGLSNLPGTERYSPTGSMLQAVAQARVASGPFPNARRLLSRFRQTGPR